MVFVDGVNADPKPLVAALAGEFEVVKVRDGSPELEEISGNIRTVWHLRPSRNESSARVHAGLESEFNSDQRGYLAYADWERRLLAAFGRVDDPTHHYLVTKWARR